MDEAKLGGAAIAALGVVIWWLMRHTHAKVDSEREARERALAEERRGREEDRHALRNEINNVGAKLHAHELHVANEYVNHDRLTMALAPLQAGVERVEGTLGRLFDELKGKQDKP